MSALTDLGLPEDPPEVRRGDPPTAHVRARLDEQVRALVHHAEGARAGKDPEHVHQMRVAVRRARSVLKTVHTHEPLQAELKWLGDALGDVRDADVLLAHLRELAADFPDDERAAVEQLLSSLEKQRRGARRHMLAALRSTRFRGLLTSLAEAALVAEPAMPKTNGAPPMVAVIRKPHRKLVKTADDLADDPPDDDLHALRIRGKRLRYAAEMAAPAAKKKVKALVSATKTFQDILGDHQDAVVAEERIRAMLDAMGEGIEVDVVLVAGRLIERERARKAECRAHWREAVAEVDEKARHVLA
ncbi:CHAD domain-containing protein [Actinokineospora sp. 24-640]